jgi:hypothetical protein
MPDVSQSSLLEAKAKLKARRDPAVMLGGRRRRRREEATGRI